MNWRRIITRRESGQKAPRPVYDELEIPLAFCVHYSGFRYGCHEFNPLENRARDLHRGDSFLETRRRFVDFLLYYRPRGMAEALGINLRKHCPLWAYPWWNVAEDRLTPGFGWFDDSEDVPDVITHFSEAGILAYRIDQEFFWQEQALWMIGKHGYRSDLYSYIEVCELRRREHPSAFIVMDGNHRISALFALGHESVRVRRDKLLVIHEDRMNEWPGVKSGRVPPDDAHAIFMAYFQGNSRWRTTDVPAQIIGHAGWKELYLPLSVPHSGPGSSQSPPTTFQPPSSSNKT